MSHEEKFYENRTGTQRYSERNRFHRSPTEALANPLVTPAVALERFVAEYEPSSPIHASPFFLFGLPKVCLESSSLIGVPEIDQM